MTWFDSRLQLCRSQSLNSAGFTVKSFKSRTTEKKKWKPTHQQSAAASLDVLEAAEIKKKRSVSQNRVRSERSTVLSEIAIQKWARIFSPGPLTQVEFQAGDESELNSSHVVTPGGHFFAESRAENGKGQLFRFWKFENEKKGKWKNASFSGKVSD